VLKTIKLKSIKEWDIVDITDRVQEQFAPEVEGFCLVYTPHTSATILVGEQEEKLLQDFHRSATSMLAGARPFLHSRFGHQTGEAHTFCFFHGCEVLLPVEKGRLRLGMLQRIFFVDTTGPREREIWVFQLKA
jgi:secondary thiamine-phosphate synthase enzyme